MNLPNTLTLVRMFLVPLLVVVLLTEFEGRRILGVSRELVAAAIFGLASAHRIQVRHFRPSVETLEDVFAKAVGEA